MPHYVITAVGPDRPGIVDELTGALHAAGANLADARMINLRGQFAMLLLAEAAAAAAAGLERAAVEAGRKIGLTLSVIPQPAATGPEGGTASTTTPGRPGSPGVPYRLKAYAMDQPGLVHRITNLLHRHGVNIEELQSRLEAGSVSGTPLFTLDLRLHVPATVPVRRLRDELEALCDTLNCDADLEPG